MVSSYYEIMGKIMEWRMRRKRQQKSEPYGRGPSEYYMIMARFSAATWNLELGARTIKLLAARSKLLDQMSNGSSNERGQRIAEQAPQLKPETIVTRCINQQRAIAESVLATQSDSLDATSQN